MIVRYRKLLTALLVLFVPAVSPASDDEANDEEGERCVNSRAIRRTDVVNDSNIIFYMLGSKIYLNSLPKICKGLSRDRRFTYVTHTRSLCELDLIRVLKDSGFTAYEGRACKLGRFQRVTEEDIAYIFEQPHKLPEAHRVEVPSVEELITDDAEDSDPQ